MRNLFPAGCRRILFVQPPQIPVEDFRLDVALSRRYFCFPPYGPALLVAGAKSSRCAADLLDLNFDFLEHLHSVHEENAINRDLWRERLLARIESFRPDTVAVTCMFTMAHASMCRIAEAVKQARPDIAVISGGVHVSNDTENILRACPQIDLAVKGEADTAFPHLLEFINGAREASDLSSVAMVRDGEFLELPREGFPEEEALRPRPDYARLDLKSYNRYGRLGAYEFVHGNRPASTVLSNRGCRARCTFCSVRQFNGMGVRGRDAGTVVDEIAHLAEHHGIRHIMWLDDDLLYDPERAMGLFEELAARDLGITWDASNGLIAAAITPQLMQAMVASGCIGFHLGLESGDPEILRKVKKPGTVENYLRAAEIFKSYPQVFVKGFLIIGFPNETIGQLLNTVKLAQAMELGWYAISILTPLPSTEIYITMKDQGLLEDNLQTSHEKSFSNTDAKQRVREEREKAQAGEFLNLFSSSRLDHVPTKAELNDFWFLMDYRVNYERILSIRDPRKVGMIARMLEDVCDRITKENPLGNLFLGVALAKLGESENARRRALLCEDYLGRSAYWRKRFEALRLGSLLADLKANQVPLVA